MNFDRLLKLLKLANHNPNDAEANSAARAATKLLGEDNYRWLEDVKKNGGKPLANNSGKSTYSEWYNPTTREYNIKFSILDLTANPRISELVIQLEHEVKGARTWNDVRRTTKPDFRSTKQPPRNGYNPFNDFRDFGWREYDKDEKQQKTAQEVKEEQDKREKEARSKWTWTEDDLGSSVKYRKVYTQKCRDCTVCKITRLTTDEQTPYVCYLCRTKGASCGI